MERTKSRERITKKDGHEVSQPSQWGFIKWWQIWQQRTLMNIPSGLPSFFLFFPHWGAHKPAEEERSQPSQNTDSRCLPPFLFSPVFEQRFFAFLPSLLLSFPSLTRTELVIVEVRAIWEVFRPVIANHSSHLPLSVNHSLTHSLTHSTNPNWPSSRRGVSHLRGVSARDCKSCFSSAAAMTAKNANEHAEVDRLTKARMDVVIFWNVEGSPVTSQQSGKIPCFHTRIWDEEKGKEETARKK